MLWISIVRREVSALVEDITFLDCLLVAGPADAGRAGGNQLYFLTKSGSQGVLKSKELHYSRPRPVFPVIDDVLSGDGGLDQLGDIILLADVGDGFSFGLEFGLLNGGHIGISQDGALMLCWVVNVYLYWVGRQLSVPIE